MTDAATLEKLEAAFATLQGQESKSLLKKYLTKEIFDKLKTKVTSFNSSLLDVIQSGKAANLDSSPILVVYLVLQRVKLRKKSRERENWI